jgi:multidrug efflux pump subunit AcrA (membrane-fusion protein)
MTERQNRPWYMYVLAVATVAIAVLAVAQIGPPTSSARTSTQIVTAASGIVQSTVSGAGNVAAGSDLGVNFQTGGTLSKVYVKAGQHVTKGELLATLDSSSAQLSLDQAEQSLTAAEDQLSTAQTNSTSTSSSTTSTASLNTGSGSVTPAFVSLTTTVPTATTTKPASTTTPSTKTTTTKTKTKTTTTTAPTATTPTSSSTTAPSTGGSSGGGSSSSTNPAATIASAQAAVYGAEASVNTAKTALANTKLYAPVSGTVVSVANLSPGNSVSAGSTGSASTSSTSSSGSPTGGGGGAGTTAGSLGGSSSSSTSTSSSSPFAEIVNTSKMTMTVAFSESDISKVKVGQSATVTLDALTGVELGAHVTAISTVGTTSSSVVSYSATLTLDQTDSRVKPGMSASASVIVSQAQGVTVPNSAVTGTGSVATVTLVSNGKKTQQQVAVGLRGNNRTQIVSGLKAGDQLAVTTTLPALTSATSTTATGGSGTLGGTTVRPGGGFPGAGGGFGGGAGGGGAGGGGARGGAGAAPTGAGATGG